MTVYILLLWHDFDCEVGGVFDSKAKAVSEAQNLEQTGGVAKDSWAVEKQKVK